MNIRPAGVALVLIISFSTPVQSGQQEEAQKNQVLPEEIVITGKRSKLQLRIQLMESEKRAYDIFNQFNNEERFNIKCDMRQPTGTRIKRQVCTPVFQLEATRAHAQDYFNSSKQFIPVEAAIAGQLQEYRSKIKQVAEEHPEFLGAVIRYTEIRKQYEDAISFGKE